MSPTAFTATIALHRRSDAQVIPVRRVDHVFVLELRKVEAGAAEGFHRDVIVDPAFEAGAVGAAVLAHDVPARAAG